MDRGKYRSLAQRIGSKGEKLFSLWSEDRGLSTTKADADYGIDFWCQVLRPVKKGAVEEATGAILAVQVKATEGESRPRVELGRIDATDLLRQTHATVLVAVNPTARAVYFAFINEVLIDRLSDFLFSDAKTHSIRLDELQSDVAKFDQNIVYYTRPGTQHRLRIYKAEKLIAASIPGASVSVHQIATGGMAVVDLPWLGSAFEMDTSAREAVRTEVFERGRTPDDIQGLWLNPVVLEAQDLVDGPLIIQGAVEANVELALECGEQKSTAIFALRRVGDERAYTHPVGLSFVVSDPRRKSSKRVHELHSRIFSGKQSLGQAMDILPFLRLLRSGAKLSFNGTEFGPIESLGPEIVKLGPAFEALERITGLLNLNLNEFHLDDFKLQEFAYSVGFLHAFLVKETPAQQFVPGFIVGPRAGNDPTKIPTEPVRVDLPIVLNLKDLGLIVWVRARGAVFLADDGRWCGLGIREQLAWSFETQGRFEKSVYPEAWIFRYWPPVLIGEEFRGTRDIGPIAPDYFKVEADITKESVVADEPNVDATLTENS